MKPGAIALCFLLGSLQAFAANTRANERDTVVLFHTWGRVSVVEPGEDSAGEDGLVGLRHRAREIGLPDAGNLHFGRATGTGTYELVRLGADGAVQVLVPGGVADARPSDSGWIAVTYPDQRIAVIDPAGREQILAERGWSPNWNHDATILSFAAKLPQEGGGLLPRTAVRLFDTGTGRAHTVIEDYNDNVPALSPDGQHVVYLSGRSTNAAFWVISASGGEPIQLTNFGEHIGPDFVPVPACDPIWDARSGRIFYAIQYGEKREIWSLTLAADRTSVVTAGRIDAGTDLVLEGGILSYRQSSSGQRRYLADTRDVRAQAMDFGARTPDTGGPMNHDLPDSRNESGAGWLWAPIKSRVPHIYNGFNSGCWDHNGHDYEAPRWAQIYSAADGWLTGKRDGHGDGGGGLGNFLVIAHGQLFDQTAYVHLQAFTLWTPPLGTWVGRGMPIARSGASGFANGVPHLHFDLLQGPWLEHLDPTPHYARDLIWSMPDDLFFVNWVSCGLFQLPAPDHRFTLSRDVEPPHFSDFAVYGRRIPGTTQARVHLECTIEDESGVYDDSTWPDFNAPMSRGVYVALDPFAPYAPSQTAPMYRVSGTDKKGRFKTVEPLIIQTGHAGGAPLVALNVGAGDRAFEGFSFGNIGNRAVSPTLFLSRVPGDLGKPGKTEVPLIDLGVEILSADAQIAAGSPVHLSVRVRNESAFDHVAGDATTQVAVSPIKDSTSAWYAKLGSFAVPTLAPGEWRDLNLEFDTPPNLAWMPQQLFVSVRGVNDPARDNSSDRVPVQVVQPQPDLVVSAIDLDEHIGLGMDTVVRFEITNAGSDYAYGGMWCGASLSLDENPSGGGDDIPMGQWFIDLSSPLKAGESRWYQFTTLQVPPNAKPGPQNFFVCADIGSPPCARICESDETNNWTFVPVQVIATDVSVVDIRTPGTHYGGTGNIPADVTLRNSGPAAVTVKVTVTIGPNWGEGWFTVPAFGETTETVDVPTPPTGPGCGGHETFLVRACAEFVDPNPSNNCLDTYVDVQRLWWGLEFKLVGVPGQAWRGTFIDWEVHVKNHGNQPSMNVCAISGITLYPGAGKWDWNLGLNYFTTPNIAPGKTWVHKVNNYYINPGALPGKQYCKVEINYSAQCFDNCVTWGNFDEDSITIY